MEIWRPINGYEWLYEVSNLGRVNNLNSYNTGKEKILRTPIDKKWYPRVRLFNNSKWKTIKVHRLVALAFIPNPENKPQVNHIDWNKLNNNLDNLEWCTNKENQYHAWKMWLCKSSEKNFFKTNNPSKWKFWKDSISSKKINQYSLSWELIKTWDSASDVRRELWILQSSISANCKWIYKTAGGFIWRYV